MRTSKSRRPSLSRKNTRLIPLTTPADAAPTQELPAVMVATIGRTNRKAAAARTNVSDYFVYVLV